MSAQPIVKVGQVWEEVDPRLNRQIEVIYVGVGRADIICRKTNKTTSAKLSRFSGRRGGYRLVKDVE